MCLTLSMSLGAAGWNWIGSPDEFRLTTAWQRFEVTQSLPLTVVGHRLEVGLQVGRSTGVLLIDDVEVWGPRSVDGVPPRVLPPPVPLVNSSGIN